MSADRPVLLDNPVQHYAWGSHTAIPELRGEPSPAPEPCAELWIGAHPSAPSRVLAPGGAVPLDRWIRGHREAVLGDAADRFDGALPFLLKVLAAERPLSIQAHPNAAQARAGFARESAAGIALDAPERCYRDANHKPELLCALTTFSALDGFRPVEETLAHFEPLAAPELVSAVSALRQQRGAKGLAAFFRTTMTLEAAPRARVLERAVAHAHRAAGEDAAWRWVARLAEAYPADIGALAPLYLNLVELAPGEALFLAAGALHSYLGGVGVEIMANSDNVLRGGLTPKHVDVPELLATLRFEAGPVERLRPRALGAVEARYETPAAEFALSVLSVGPGAPYASGAAHGVEILLCTRGGARIEDDRSGEVLGLARGGAVLVPAAAAAYHVEGDATIYKAATPMRGETATPAP